MFYKTNIEWEAAWDIPEDVKREPGISAFVRLANEEEWVRPSLESILPWVDEVVCAMQDSTDGTRDILRGLDNPKITILEYPFSAWPNGPGHERQPGNSVHNNAYFYNWNVAMTHHEWVLKWDGDMVAMDWLGDAVHRTISGAGNAVVCRSGINLVGDCTHMSRTQPTIMEMQPCMFRPGPNTYYTTGKMTQVLQRPSKTKTLRINRPSYLHFKWAKESRFQGWPDDWQKIPHFAQIAERAEPGKPYTGEIPTPLKGRLQ